MLACNGLSNRRRRLHAPHIHFPHASVSARMLTDDLLLVLHLCIFMRADCCRLVFLCIEFSQALKAAVGCMVNTGFLSAR